MAVFDVGLGLSFKARTGAGASPGGDPRRSTLIMKCALEHKGAPQPAISWTRNARRTGFYFQFPGFQKGAGCTPLDLFSPFRTLACMQSFAAELAAHRVTGCRIVCHFIWRPVHSGSRAGCYRRGVHGRLSDDWVSPPCCNVGLWSCFFVAHQWDSVGHYRVRVLRAPISHELAWELKRLCPCAAVATAANCWHSQTVRVVVGAPGKVWVQAFP